MTGALLLPLGSAVATAAAVLLWRPPARWLLAMRLRDAARPSTMTPGSALALMRRWAARWSGGLPVLIGLVGAPWLVASPVSALLLATVVGVSAFGLRQVARERAAREAAATSARVAAALELLAAELRTGVLPAVALRGACDDLPALRPVAEVSARGGDVPAALDLAAALPGAADLGHLSAAWRVAEQVGAPVASVLEHVVESVRADHDLAREVRAECSSARATARLLAVLPLLGLGLGSGMGGDPVHVLTATLPGVLCLAAGSALAVVGLVWVERIVSRAGAATA